MTRENADVALAHLYEERARIQEAIDGLTRLYPNASKVGPTDFAGMRLSDAVRLCLSCADEPLLASDISNRLVDGGYSGSCTSLYNNVHTTLGRLLQKGMAVRFKKKWALAEWYPRK